MRVLKHKRFALLIIALAYSIGATGIALHAHFCRGEFHSIEIVLNGNSSSCGCQKKSESCCKDVTGYFSLEDDHSAGMGYSIPPCNFSACDISQFENINISTPRSVYAYYQPTDDPPDDCALPLYLFVRNLRH